MLRELYFPPFSYLSFVAEYATIFFWRAKRWILVAVLFFFLSLFSNTIFSSLRGWWRGMRWQWLVVEGLLDGGNGTIPFSYTPMPNISLFFPLIPHDYYLLYYTCYEIGTSL